MKICQVVVIIFTSLLTVIQYSLPAPVLPLEMKRRHITQTSTGVAMASYSVGFIFGSIFPTDKLYSWLGRRKTSQCGIFFLSVALFLYAIAYCIPDDEPLFFYVACIITRIFEGFCIGLALTGLFSLFILSYPHSRGRAIAARNCGTNLGMSLGAVLGGSLVMLLGYFGVFLTFSILSLLTMFLLYVFKEVKGHPSKSNESQLSICQYFKVRRAILTQICNGLCDLLLHFLEPTLAVHLRTEFHFS